MNYIEKIENLTNKALKSLILSGNSIKEITNLEYLNDLELLDLQKNSIETVSILSSYDMKSFKKLICSFNNISVEYFDEFVYVMQSIPSIEEVNFQGNEITLHRNYKMRLIQFPNLKILDKLELNYPIRKHAEVGTINLCSHKI